MAAKREDFGRMLLQKRRKKPSVEVKMRYCRVKKYQGVQKVMPYSAICLIAECLISGIFYLRKEKKKVGTFKNMPYSANNAIDGCLQAGLLCI